MKSNGKVIAGCCSTPCSLLFLPLVFLREFGCVYWGIATAPGWHPADRWMARYFWPLCVISLATLPWAAPQRVKLEKKTRPQQEQAQPQAVSPEKGTARLGSSEDNLVRVDVTAEVGGIAPDEYRSGEIKDEADKVEGPDVHVLNSPTNARAMTPATESDHGK